MSDQFDPQATEEEAASKSQYMSWKDLRVLGLVLVGFVILLIPIYQFGKKKSEKAQCQNNFQAMADAVLLYAKDHDDGFPPLYRTGLGNTPALNRSGLPFTWASDISVYMNTRASFRCPSADESEVAYVEDPQVSKKKLAVTYGMYAPWGGWKTFNIENPDTTLIISETSNLGSAGSYDPVKFPPQDGRPTPDAFVIGWDTSNDAPSRNSRHVTRLAFRNSANGDFSNAVPRHDEGIHSLSVTGARIMLQKGDARLQFRDGRPSGYWSVPARLDMR